MHCPHCGNEFKQAGPSPGGLVVCPACGKGFPDPSGRPPVPRGGGAAAAGLGVVAMVIAGVAICGLLGCVGALVALLLPAVQATREAANRVACQNNLKQLAIAMHNYHDFYQALPAQAVLDENGRPMHSWRTALLPFVEQSQLFERYNFNEPWDSPSNQMVGQQFVPTYACPAHRDHGVSNETSYFVVYGEQTMFAPNRWIGFDRVSDGTSNTIMIVESNSMHVPWSQPIDIPLDQMRFHLNQPDSSVSSPHANGVNVAFGDGSVKFLSDDMSEETFRYALIKDDGMVVELP